MRPWPRPWRRPGAAGILRRPWKPTACAPLPRAGATSTRAWRGRGQPRPFSSTSCWRRPPPGSNIQPLKKAMAQVTRAQDLADASAADTVVRTLQQRRPGGAGCRAVRLPPPPPVDGTSSALASSPSAQSPAEAVDLRVSCWERPERGLLGGLASPRRVDFVVAHCREPLDWLQGKLERVPEGAALYIYEKCGSWTRAEELATFVGVDKFQEVYVVARPDKGSTRGDECSGYLTHIVGHYEQLADYTVFLQSDPQDHLHFDFLDLVLRTIAAGTYRGPPFLALNGPRHVRTLTPCLQGVHEELFGTNLTELLAPYCCAQFLVTRDGIRSRDAAFYGRMLSLVDGTRDVDLCGIEGAKRSTQCYGFEFLWHMVFGEAADPPSREDDGRLPVALRLKHGREHVRLNWASVPLARDIPLKIVPDTEHGNPLHVGEDQ
eukprot:TRINITY_DN24340_c0_g1_i5.p1 TRINITY_DN24340_c0_g1~~TRINITY_DN24340_c0_g1_i5.p1  ORF type:complete len:434 (-),score=91.39 TRINITY_DN24340_c0_g1_i5:66-1367(-)